MNKNRQILLLLEWYDYRIHQGVANIAKDEGWFLYCPSKSGANSKEVLDYWDGDGCILLLANQETIDFIKDSKKMISTPTVDFGLYDLRRDINRVVPDNQEVIRLAVDHFRDQGYKEIFTVSPGDNQMCQERYKYLKKFMETNGGKVNLLETASHSDRSFHISINDEIIKELEAIAIKRNLKSKDELSIGFFAYDDVMAAQMIRLLLHYDIRIPETIAVLGVDNDELVNSTLNIGLSSIDCDLVGLGERAAIELKNILNKKNQSSGKIIRHKPKGLIARRSTDCYAVKNPLVSEALYWIQNNFQKGILATNVAEALGVTQQGLQKAFHENYIRTPGQEIRYQRSMAVANLLECTNATLEEIAQNCGYYSVDTLINGFKEHFKTTPGKYRRDKKIKST